MNRDAAYIANICEQQWIAQRTYGTFVVHACPAGHPFGLTEVGPRKGTIDLGDNRILEFPISAREVAEDLAREANSDGGEGSFFGVFVCAGERPSDEELAQARRRLEEFYRRMVLQADQEWERSHDYTMITDVQRRAAHWLGVEKDWAYDPKPMAECPACGERVKQGAAVCRACGAVLDREKAARFGLVAPEPAATAPAARPREGKSKTPEGASGRA